ncbi:glycosyltransferase family 9 protein [Micromonospora sp. NBC_01813]|uniref:glycosyltransferase family 9 protein n=1 Tax=Micromonospora sp. NBC_01813 TaxID=2975988 RepID=UPI002DDAC812|nr:glycosyltransferase family 9 protein [Micromonospora sp. NBC_01813]WSA11050.1 glycosyltransferase family 9 protein [Micromonospora sp. NBC_01813]
MILVLRALGIGDLATVVPALRGLRAGFPATPIALAAPAVLAPLADLIDAVDRLVPLSGLDTVPALDADPDWAVNLHGRGPRSHQLLRATRPGRLWAYECPQAAHPDGPPWRDDEPEVSRWCRLLAWYGVDTDPADLLLRRPPPDRVQVGVTVVHPGAASPRRRWPAERFAELARRLARAGHRVVVTGSARERPLAEAVAAGAGLPATAVCAGRMDLSRFVALLSHARLLVAADTGVGHLATAFAVPSVLLFGPTSPTRWGPTIDRQLHRVLQYPALSRGTEEPGVADGEPVEPLEPVDPAMAAICVGEVLAAVEQVERAAAAA